MNTKTTQALWFAIVAIALLMQVVAYSALVAVCVAGILGEVPGAFLVFMVGIVAASIALVTTLAMLNGVVWTAYEHFSLGTDAEHS